MRSGVLLPTWLHQLHAGALRSWAVQSQWRCHVHGLPPGVLLYQWHAGAPASGSKCLSLLCIVSQADELLCVGDVVVAARQLPCEAGRWSSDVGRSVPCTAPCGDAASYCPTGSVAPFAVPVGWYSLPVSSPPSLRASATPCLAGSYCDAGNATLCTGGTYSDVQGRSTPCNASCPEGMDAPFTPLPCGELAPPPPLSVSVLGLNELPRRCRCMLLAACEQDLRVPLVPACCLS